MDVQASVLSHKLTFFSLQGLVTSACSLLEELSHTHPDVFVQCVPPTVSKPGADLGVGQDGPGPPWLILNFFFFRKAVYENISVLLPVLLCTACACIR